MDEVFVKVPLSTYQRFIELAERDKAFSSAVLAASWLTETGELRFQPDVLRELIRVMFSEEYDARVFALQEREARLREVE